MDLLPKKEQVDVLKYIHVKDAKMALVSRLLKRYLISRYAPCAWDAATPTPNKNTKPVYIAPDGSEPVIFNVTHQAGLIVLIASVRPKPGMSVGVDIVCPTERRDKDLGLISKDGWKEYVSMHEEVLSQAECTSLNRLPFKDLDHRLRYFYTLWCLREAYVKMTGEALLAPWLKRLEMRYFAPPEDAPISQTEIWFQGRLLDDVDLDLVNVLDGFIICTATKRGKKGDSLELGEYELLDIEDAIAFGEGSRELPRKESETPRPIVQKAMTFSPSVLTR
ncbi:L-aminoadipate-semialdehyde dehydrogenase-phosphopantetheinyl transferase-like protein [Emericellopsis cladophorae]|uniref:holo-[acyl-carrier-protein] synthase n=1 Tax=Emericellopsis cladophorae TaxID=2686198 RepID=A0A9P9XW99_9HYPO|nr:L-aminoadipate-semialdehyde dehydrogenase-phosphopantetheinyl transferase-like protein [Emericellopsis cladophorae]KAI6778915.1 L-aminoadipate-semialdehyde dehydrogenase-phosphopantetheinyl transferase-like protein [Emericellopsis cladophorae]